jgi:hypothetical protein
MAAQSPTRSAAAPSPSRTTAASRTVSPFGECSELQHEGFDVEWLAAVLQAPAAKAAARDAPATELVMTISQNDKERVVAQRAADLIPPMSVVAAVEENARAGSPRSSSARRPRRVRTTLSRSAREHCDRPGTRRRAGDQYPGAR